MKIGFALPQAGPWATPDAQFTVARRAEELGYHSLWTFQRLLYVEDGTMPAMYRTVLDPIVSLSAVAARTERIRLGVAVLNIPFIAPALMSRTLTSLDLLSRGRLDVGFGVGWHRDEFAAAGTELAGRGRRAEDFLEALKLTWRGGEVEYDGPYYAIPRSVWEPVPVQRPHPPIILGGLSEPALRRAGRVADGWVSSSRADLGELAGQIATVRRAAEEAGRDPASLRFISRGPLHVRPAGRDDRRRLTGSYEEIRGDFADLAAQGVTEVFLDPNYDPEIAGPDADPKAAMARTEEAMAALAPR
ncbi:MAG: TIGR03619 family F420-dependent LLM class oxidoreductase [Streptosporangiales bacterium]|nr:TIGR03619 family F420-dependent LLM class oxidoreductase [Streptosporangiales bacterium]